MDTGSSWQWAIWRESSLTATALIAQVRGQVTVTVHASPFDEQTSRKIEHLKRARNEHLGS